MKTRINRLSLILVAASLAISAIVTAPAWGKSANANLQQPGGGNAPGAAGTIFLPMLSSANPAWLMGAEFPNLDASSFSRMREAGLSLVRKNTLDWSIVESTQGVYDWSGAADIEAELRIAGAQNVPVILTVRNSPSWAQQYSGSACGPIRQDKFQSFGNFLGQAVARYSVAPYSVKYLEIWNEEDIQMSQSQQGLTSIMGCWGDQNDSSHNFGGQYFGQMLKAVAPMIRRANPEVKILIGGLVLDCNIDAGLCPAGSYAPNFLRGILSAATGGDYSYFDGVSFHAYDYYVGNYFPSDPLGKYANPNWQSASTPGAQGPVLAAKAAFIRKVLNQYGVSGKLLLNTEVSLIYAPSAGQPTVCDASCEQSKAYYAVESYSAALAQGLTANIWYTAKNSWRYSGLFADSGVANPAYYAYKFLNQEMEGSRFVVLDQSTYPGVTVYKFNRGSLKVWVVWSTSGSKVISLPGKPSGTWVWDSSKSDYVAGTLTSSLSVTRAPMFLEWAP